MSAISLLSGFIFAALTALLAHKVLMVVFERMAMWLYLLFVLSGTAVGFFGGAQLATES